MGAAAINPRLLPGGDVYEADVAAGRQPWIERLTATPGGAMKAAVLTEWAKRREENGGVAPDPLDIAEDIDVDIPPEEIDAINAEAAAEMAGATPIIPANAILTPVGTISVSTTTVVAAAAVLTVGILAFARRR